MLEIMMSQIQYEQAVSIMTILQDLLDFEVVLHSGKNRVNQVDTLQLKVASSFLCYSVNPLKTVVMLIFIASEIEKKYEMLAFKARGF